MINNIINLGVTVPVVGIIYLYAIGTIYYSSLLSTLGFVSYTGDIDTNQLLFINLNSCVLTGATAANLIAILYISKLYSDIDKFNNATNEADKITAANDYIRKHKTGIFENTISYLSSFSYISLVLYHFIWGVSINGINMILGLFLAALFFAAIKMKSYDVKWLFSVVAVIILLFHSSYAGNLDAGKIIKSNRKVTLNLEGKNIECQYLMQDTTSYYIFFDNKFMAVKKNIVSSIVFTR